MEGLGRAFYRPAASAAELSRSGEARACHWSKDGELAIVAWGEMTEEGRGATRWVRSH